jgi:predicted nuclease of restriction endonuclease-like (RecB) superfamily
MNYYNEIKNKLLDDEIYEKVKDYSKERHRVITYYEVGKLLNDAGKHYGEDIIGNYSKKLVVEVGKKYNSRTLRRMRQLYYFFERQKWSPLGTKISISHIRQLFSFDDISQVNYYVEQIEKRNLSKRQLETIIKNKEYERLPEETKRKLITKEEKLDINDLVPNPILIKNKNNIEIVTEKVLHNLILEDIESFMKELGSSFCYIGSEYKIKICDRYNYIDFLLFNIKYNAYVVIELKVTEFKVEYIAQVQKYMNYIDKNIKETSNNATIGILICKKENKFVIEYCSDVRITVRKYELV